MNKLRKDNEQPPAINEWGWRYHHIGIPTREKKEGEKYISYLGFYTSGFPASPFGIEWMRFEEKCTLHPLVKTIPHVAFEVDDLDHELKIRKLKILTEPNPPSDGVRVAMVEHNGAPVELIEFNK